MLSEISQSSLPPKKSSFCWCVPTHPQNTEETKRNPQLNRHLAICYSAFLSIPLRNSRGFFASFLMDICWNTYAMECKACKCKVKSKHAIVKNFLKELREGHVWDMQAGGMLDRCITILLNLHCEIFEIWSLYRYICLKNNSMLRVNSILKVPNAYDIQIGFGYRGIHNLIL